MAKRRPEGFDLDQAMRDRGFSPRAEDLDPLLAMVDGVDDERAELAERAVARAGLAGARAAMERFPSAAPPLRGRLCRLIGRVGREHAEPTLAAFLVERLADPDDKTRRNAIVALGKGGGGDAERALIDAWKKEAGAGHRRSIAEALGKIGGNDALALLRTVTTDDAELSRIVSEATIKLSRTLVRDVDAPIAIDLERVVRAPMRATLHCRAGVEAIVAEEAQALDRALAPRVARTAMVDVTLTSAMQTLMQLRTVLRFAFPLPVQHGEPVDAVVRALSSDEAWTTFDSFRADKTRPIRYRIEWSSGGHRRAATYRCAEAIARARPELMNDPVASTWEAVVLERDSEVFVELWPRGLDDLRFRYRRGDVQGASHPTITAALARVLGVRDDDVVWDPFVGSGGELIERALLGPYRALIGTDLDRGALDVARRNADAAGVVGLQLMQLDARSFRPVRPITAIVTNPPMGRRVLRDQPLEPLFDALLSHAAQLLPSGGRFVWLSPLGNRTAAVARDAGFDVQLRQRVDMGGFSAELQRLVRR